jgi:hypothetical protein
VKLKIFLSHAWADKEHSLLKTLMNHLQNTDNEVWIDKKRIDFGENIHAKLERAIHDCDVFIVAWSRNALASKDVNFEMQCAHREGKPIVPCMIDDLSTDESDILRGFKYIQLTGDAGRDQAQLSFLQNSLLARKFTLMDPNNLPEEQREEWHRLRSKMDELKDFFVEAADIDYRQKSGVSGNDSSNPYLQSTMGAFEKTMAGDPGQEKMLRFIARMKEVSERYPDRKDDDLKQRLMLQAIYEIDPAGEDSSFTEMRADLERQYGDSVARPSGAANTAISFTQARAAASQADQITDLLLAGTKGTPSGQLQLFGVQKAIREGSAFLMEPAKAREPTELRDALTRMQPLRQWCKDNNAPDTENDTLWVMNICFSRLNRPSEAADALLALQANLDAKAGALTDPKAIAEVYDTYSLLQDSLCNALESAGRTKELARARARPN